MLIERKDDVLIRRLDVTTRLTDQVVDLCESADGGVLLETWVGRYVLNQDARRVWLLIDGRRTIRQLVDDVVAASGQQAADVEAPVIAVCDRLLDLGLIEVSGQVGAATLR